MGGGGGGGGGSTMEHLETNPITSFTQWFLAGFDLCDINVFLMILHIRC